jgi:ferredoxin
MNMVAAAVEKQTSYLVEPDLRFIRELAAFGATTFSKCYQCATCSASCSISPDEDPFPRKEVLWAKWGLTDRLAKDLDVWACYYCGDCSVDCPRGADPGETMMALRRYMTSLYDWTGISRLLYTSRVREIAAVLLMGLIVVGLFYFSGAFTPERMITDHVSVNTFVPVEWVHLADWVMAGILTFFLLTNTFRMWRMTMAGTKVPLSSYISNLKTFMVHAATQKKWRECAKEDTRGRWLKHFIFVPAYVAMFVLVMFFLDVLQVDTSEFTWVSILGYVITFRLGLDVPDPPVSHGTHRHSDAPAANHGLAVVDLLHVRDSSRGGRAAAGAGGAVHEVGAFDVQATCPLPEGGEGERSGSEGVAGAGEAALV